MLLFTVAKGQRKWERTAGLEQYASICLACAPRSLPSVSYLLVVFSSGMTQGNRYATSESLMNSSVLFAYLPSDHPFTQGSYTPMTREFFPWFRRVRLNLSPLSGAGTSDTPLTSRMGTNDDEHRSAVSGQHSKKSEPVLNPVL